MYIKKIKIYLGTWQEIIRRFGVFSFCELAKFFEMQKNNSTIPPNYRTFVRQITHRTASYLAVTQGNKNEREQTTNTNDKME